MSKLKFIHKLLFLKIRYYISQGGMFVACLSLQYGFISQTVVCSEGEGGGAWDQELEKPLGSHSRIKVAPVMTIRRLIEAIIFQKTFCKCMLVIVISYYSQ